MSQFRNIDAASKPQQVHIVWERVLLDDEHADGPDENDEGFWPSLDPNAPGWIGDNPQVSFDEQQEKAQERYDGFGNWWNYVGVIARAHISVPIGGGSFCTFQIDSPGLWGVESDAGEYLDEVFTEQKDDLLAMIETMGLAVKDGTLIQE